MQRQTIAQRFRAKALLGMPLGRCVLSDAAVSSHLAEALVTDHLDPRLPRDANAGTFRIDLPQEVERKINIDPLFRYVAIGKRGRDIFSPLRTFGNGLDLVEGFGLRFME